MSFVLLFFVLVYVMNLGYLMSDTTSNPNVAGDDESKEVIMDPLADHTFVALLDIVFTDGSKRTCTGTIIHESVVLTAAHCFTNPENEMAKPELLASFVVIGTKKMFSTGYEHYLPIEKILIHPKYQGWTADLALVYTFASMTGHKPGTIVNLAGERTSTHVDANVTVLSWGGPSETVEDNKKNKYCGKSDCESDEDDNVKAPLRSRVQTMMPYDLELEQKHIEDSERVFKSRPDKKTPKHGLRSNPTSMREEKAKRYLGIDEERINSLTTDYDLGGPIRSNEEIIIDNDFVTEPAFLVDEHTSSNSVTKNKTPSKNILPESAYGNLRKFDQIVDDELETLYGNRRSRLTEWPESIYVNSRRFAEIQNEQIRQNPYYNFRRFDQSYKDWSIYRKPEETPQPTSDSVDIKSHYRNWRRLMGTQDWSIYRKPEETPQPTTDSFDIKSHYRNWRRLMGTQQNQLKVDIFGFVNQKLCEGMVEKVMPVEFHIGNKNDVVCFSGDDQYITDDDSGAPVLRRGKLIAVAIGGVRHDNANVAIGMKMSCYCSWIVENLPEPTPDIACCYNCCEVTHLKDGVVPPQARNEPKARLISF